MRLVERVEGFRTSNGVIHADEAAAELAQGELDRNEALRLFVERHFGNSHHIFTDEIIEVLREHHETLLHALNGQLPDDCTECGGAGRYATSEDNEEDCPGCNGTGELSAQLANIDEGERDALDLSTLDPDDPPELIEDEDGAPLSPEQQEAAALAVHLSEPRADDDVPF